MFVRQSPHFVCLHVENIAHMHLQHFRCKPDFIHSHREVQSAEKNPCEDVNSNAGGEDKPSDGA